MNSTLHSGRRSPLDPRVGLRHVAALYEGPRGFLDHTTTFIRDALGNGDPLLVMVTADKVAMLASELGSDARRIKFSDMGTAGRNPARIIPTLRDFFTQPSARAIAEPIWVGRTHAELVESQRYERLLNVALSTTSGMLLCPYDIGSLPSDVIDEAMASHPVFSEHGAMAGSDRYQHGPAPLDIPLSPPRTRPKRRALSPGDLSGMRRFVSEQAGAFGIVGPRNEELVLAVNEVASNALRHGGGHGTLQVWHEGDVFLCEVTDTGTFSVEPSGRSRPATDSEGGFGLWLANQICDLVQVRSFPHGSVVRLHMSRRSRL